MKKLTKEQRRESVIERSYAQSMGIDETPLILEIPQPSKIETARRVLDFNMNSQMCDKASWNNLINK